MVPYHNLRVYTDNREQLGKPLPYLAITLQQTSIPFKLQQKYSLLLRTRETRSSFGHGGAFDPITVCKFAKHYFLAGRCLLYSNIFTSPVFGITCKISSNVDKCDYR